jgi:hypothetical protein
MPKGLKSKSLPPAGIGPNTRICVVGLKEQWAAPVDGKACTNRRHVHMGLGRVEQLMADGLMEMVRGLWTNAQGEEEPAWIPVARFVQARHLRPKYSYDPVTRIGMVTVQLVA